MTTVVLVLAALWLVACLVYSTPRFFGRRPEREVIP